jgi:hypothetical protein
MDLTETNLGTEHSARQWEQWKWSIRSTRPLCRGFACSGIPHGFNENALLRKDRRKFAKTIVHQVAQPLRLQRGVQ